MTRALIRLLITGCIFIGITQAQIRFVETKRDVVEARLAKATKRNIDRKNALVALFEEAGCAGHLTEQVVKGSKLPNVICVLPGSEAGVLVVGAHYDKVDDGMGVIDNWSGAALLPTLFESLGHQPRKHTIVFIGFADEEKGLVGSQAYVKSLKKDEIARIHAMLNLDTLGLSETKVWRSHSDMKLVNAIATVAQAMKSPVTAMDIENVGSSDSESFADVKVPRITFHSLTEETWPLLHTAKDTAAAIKMDAYFESYRLIAGYLAALDQWLTAEPPAEKNVSAKEKTQ